MTFFPPFLFLITLFFGPFLFATLPFIVWYLFINGPFSSHCTLVFWNQLVLEDSQPASQPDRQVTITMRWTWPLTTSKSMSVALWTQSCCHQTNKTFIWNTSCHYWTFHWLLSAVLFIYSLCFTKTKLFQSSDTSKHSAPWCLRQTNTERLTNMLTY